MSTVALQFTHTTQSQPVSRLRCPSPVANTRSSASTRHLQPIAVHSHVLSTLFSSFPPFLSTSTAFTAADLLHLHCPRPRRAMHSARLAWQLSCSCVLLLLLSCSRVTAQPTSNSSGVLYYQSIGNATIHLLFMGQAFAPACNGSDLQVQLVTGSLFNRQISYVLPPGVDVTTAGNVSTPLTDNCLFLSTPHLSRGGLALSSGHVSVYQVSYNSTHYLLSPSVANTVSPNTTLVLTSAPFVVPVVGPTVGYLFNAGFDAVISASLVNAPADFAAGWTGGYTVGQYPPAGQEVPANAAPLLSSQSAFSQKYFVYLNTSLVQSTVPLLLGGPYNLTWYDLCVPTANFYTAICTYTVSVGSTVQYITRFPSTVWTSNSLLYTANRTDSPTPTVTFTRIAGLPQLDSVAFLAASNSSSFPITVDPFQC